MIGLQLKMIICDEDLVILQVIIEDLMISKQQQSIDKVHVMNDIMYQVQENGVKFLNIGVSITLISVVCPI